MCTVGDEAPDRICPAMAIASLIGIAKPCPRPRWKFCRCGGVHADHLVGGVDRGATGVTGRMFASTWIKPFRVSVLPVSASFADTVWFSAPMRPSSTLGAPPAPPALPSDDDRLAHGHRVGVADVGHR